MKTWAHLSALIVLLLQQPAMVQSEDIDRFLAVLDAIKARQDGYNPVDVQYKVRRTYTKLFFASAQRIDLQDRRLWAGLRDATILCQCRYAAKGHRLLQEADAPAVSAAGQVGETSRGKSIYDGTLYRTTGGDGKIVSVSRGKNRRSEEPLKFYNGEESLLRLRPILKGGTKPDLLTVIDNPDQVPGAALHFHIVFGKGQQESIEDVWVAAAEKGHGILRLESRLGGQLFHEYTDCEYKPVDGVWFPYKAVHRNYYHNKNIHQLAAEDRLEVERITCRGDEIPDSLFVIPITGETELIDRDRQNLRIVGSDKVEKHIMEAVADVQRGKSGGGWRSWVYISASTLLLLGSAYLAFRIIRTRRKRMASGR